MILLRKTQLNQRYICRRHRCLRLPTDAIDHGTYDTRHDAHVSLPPIQEPVTRGNVQPIVIAVRQTQTFCEKCENVRYRGNMSWSVGLTQVWNDTIKLANPENPSLIQEYTRKGAHRAQPPPAPLTPPATRPPASAVGGRTLTNKPTNQPTN